MKISRRKLLASALAAFPVIRVAVASPSPAPDPFAGLEVLAPGEWRHVSALLDQVWPRTDAMPSATEGGCLTFLSRRLAGRLPGYKVKAAATPDGLLTAYYRRVIERTDELSRELKGKAFMALPEPDRHAVVARLAQGSRADVGYNVVGLPTPATARDPELFAMVRRHLLEGYFCDPRSGGNTRFRNWEAIGHVCHSNFPREHRCDPAKKHHR